MGTQVAGIEGCQRVDQRAPSRGPGRILHTNHALVAEIANDEDEPADAHLPIEQAQAEGSSAGRRQRVSRDHIAAALGNREGFPDSICKSPSDAEGTQTAFSIIAECGRGVLQVCPGSPAEHAYYPILLPA